MASGEGALPGRGSYPCLCCRLSSEKAVMGISVVLSTFPRHLKAIVVSHKDSSVPLASVHRQALSNCYALVCVLPGCRSSSSTAACSGCWRWTCGNGSKVSNSSCAPSLLGELLKAVQSLLPYRSDELLADHNDFRGSFSFFWSVVFGVTLKSVFRVSCIVCFKVFSVDVYLWIFPYSSWGVESLGLFLWNIVNLPFWLLCILPPPLSSPPLSEFGVHFCGSVITLAGLEISHG